MKTRRSFASSLHLAIFATALFMLSAAASALTTIQSITSQPNPAQPGQTVTHVMSGVTDAGGLEGSASFSLSRDGVVVFSDTAPTFLDTVDVGTGFFQEAFSLPESAHSVPGSYVLVVTLDGLESGETPFTASGSTSFTVSGVVGESVIVSPSSLTLSGGAGETPTTTFTVISGTAPFTFVSTNEEGRGSFSVTSAGLNEPVEYGFRIPGAATEDTVIEDTIIVTDANGATATVLATINVSADTPITQDDIDDALQALAQTEPQRATARAIGIICPSGSAEPRLQEDCNVVVGGALQPDGSELQTQAGEALAQITTDQATASVEVSQTTMQGQLRNLGSRISALRHGATGLSTRGLSLNIDGQLVPAGELADGFLQDLSGARGGAAGGDTTFDFGRLGVFVNGQVTQGDRDRTDNVAGFEFDTISITAGADYRFTDQVVAGAALGYSSSDTDLDGNGGGVESDGYSISIYGTYFEASGLYLDGSLTYGSNSFDQKRNIRYTIGTVTVDQTAKADFDGDQWSASVGGGYNFSRGPLSFGPTARLEYVKTEVDGFSEKMSAPTANGGGWATEIESQDFTSLTTRLGGEVAYAVSTGWGVLLPNAQIEWVHEFEDSGSDVVGRYLQDTSGTAFSFAADDVDRNYYNLSLGVSAQFADGQSAYLYYRKLFGYDDYDADTFGGGVRLEF